MVWKNVDAIIENKLYLGNLVAARSTRSLTGTILVHDGLSRSAAVVAAYLMWSHRINATKALETIRRAREQIWPNAGFQEQLVLFELCQYMPSPTNGIYQSWRYKLDRRLRAAGLR
ncbi:hypothetical protein C8R43DRAFT_1092944 [Mycena crocata]|nr:hypothetical protein C8R43DRAFT_1092944 [Mycena crocata]